MFIIIIINIVIIFIIMSSKKYVFTVFVPSHVQPRSQGFSLKALGTRLSHVLL